MNKKLQKISVVLILVLMVSAFASISAFAASEQRVDTKQGGYVTISNVIEEKKIEDIGNGDTIYIAEEPVIVSFNGNYARSTQVTYFPNKGKPEEIEIKDGSATLSKTGKYGVLAVFGEGYDPSNTATFQIQVTGGSTSGGTTVETKSEPKSDALSATPTASKVLVNGKEVSFEAYNINGNNYFKLRDLAAAVNSSKKQFEVGWDESKNAISLISQKTYTSVGGELAVSIKPVAKNAKPTSSKIYLDSKEIELTAYNIDGNNYFKLRDIAKAINFGVTWDAKVNTVGIDTKSAYKEE